MATKREREMEQEIKQAMRRTWEYIAGDTLQMIKEQDGRRYATKEEVIEMVLDAGRTEQNLEGMTLHYFQTLNWERVGELANQEFKHSRYC